MADSRFKSWQAYEHSFKLAGSIFRMTNVFPKEEMYSLTDQIRRSSRSVCANLAESYGKRTYPKYFQSKLTDCASENFETQVWLDFALNCNYITADIHGKYINASERAGKLISYMQAHPEQFLSAGFKRR